jgi:hypothetical protein
MLSPAGPVNNSPALPGCGKLAADARFCKKGSAWGNA